MRARHRAQTWPRSASRAPPPPPFRRFDLASFLEARVAAFVASLALHQNPDFGFEVARLIAGRLSDDGSRPQRVEPEPTGPAQ